MSIYRLNVLAALFSSAYSLGPSPTPSPTPPPPPPSPTPAPSPAPSPSAPALPSTQLYTPQVDPVLVVGKQASYAMPSTFTGTVVSQQWYRNKGDGSGPVAIAGATGATYTPVSGDVGYWPSVWVTDNLGNVWRSLEFIGQSTPVGNSGVITGPALSNPSYQQAATSTGVRAPVTVYGVATIRIYDTQHTGYYIDNYMAPGTYAAYTGPTNWQENTLFAATGGSGDYNTQLHYVASPSPRAILAQTAAPAATATRPAGNTGNGFYVAANGHTYDPMGNEYRIRGVNQLHWNSISAGLPNSGANTVRLWIDPRSSGSNVSQITDYMSKSIVPMLCLSFTWASFTATCDGSNTITVTSMAAGGNAGRIYVGQSLAANGSFAACTVTGVGTGTGLTGTYTVSVAQPAGTYTVSSTSVGTTGSSSAAQIAACIDWMCDMAPTYTPYNKYIMLNPGNEWGPLGQDAGNTNPQAPATGANTVWRDAWVAGVPRLRAAGYTCPIVIDATSSGQDAGNGWTILNHGAAIASADTFQNIIFAPHVYGYTKPGQFAGVAAQYDAFRAAHGAGFVVGEFAQGLKNVDGASGYTTGLEVMATCEAYNIGWMPWCWDSVYNYANGTAYVDNSTYGMVYTYSTSGGAGYGTSNPADLTLWGKTAVLDPIYGLKNIAVKATAGSFA